MDKKDQKLPRTQRLKSHKMISRLFDRNSKDCFTVPVYPYRAVVFREPDTPAGFPEVLVSVPKRSFKKAVLRNRIKRLTREAYRLQKTAFAHKTYIAFLYVGKEVPEFSQVQRAVGAILDKLK
ncbi:MAG: ribonuclease P protein component [Leadbetterella sp.]|nr:ribonuclease P protein component [Leadbetterella sp.]